MLLLKDLNHHDHLGQTLLKKNLIQPESLRQALRVQLSTHNKRLGEILVEMGAITKEAIQRALMEDANLMRVQLDDFDIDLQVLGLVPVSIANDLHLIPLMYFKDALVFAVSEIPDEQSRALLRFTVDHRLIFVLAKREEIDQAIRHWYPNFSEDMELENLEQTTADLEDEQRIWSNADQLAKKAPLVRLVDSIIRDAIHQHASDIHLRPSEKLVDLLFRIDGTLINIRQFKIGLLPAMVSRIKILSRLNIAEHRIPQDGRIKIKEADNNIDLRISIIPMQFGESVVIRVLNKNEGLRSIDQIGFDPLDRELFHDLIKRSYGIILVTGPTGSGKSTTLYAALQEVSRENLNVITVEDPIEYELANTRQIQLEQHINFGFPQALRHILRHDPDIIMIGEMRDSVSFTAAMSAADTGHLVLSTLHTTNAAQSVSRILDFFKADEREQIRRQLAGTLQAVVCQRMVATISHSMTPALEILINTPTVHKLIEENRLDKLPAAIETGNDDGMINFNQSLFQLVKEGRVTEAEALTKASNPQALEMNFKGIFLDEGRRILQ